MPVDRRVTHISMSAVPIYTPGWSQTVWCKDSCPRKQHNGRDQVSNHRPSVLNSKGRTTTQPRPHAEYQSLMCDCSTKSCFHNDLRFLLSCLHYSISISPFSAPAIVAFNLFCHIYQVGRWEVARLAKLYFIL